MRIVVSGGTGPVGTRLVQRLRKKGHEVVTASPHADVDTITNEGRADALAGALAPPRTASGASRR
jgi:uncharacterized protein YbjT (DUF2867 family)